MLMVFGCKDDDSFLWEDLGIKWVTNFKLLGIHFDQTLENMNINYEKAITKVKMVANNWKNRYVSIYGKVCVVKTLMLPKLTHIATVLPTLTAKQIKEVEKIWHNYISPKKASARADIKTIHAPTAEGGLGLHHLKEFWQALKVSWIKRLATSQSFWVQILALRSNLSTCTLQNIKFLKLEDINKCKNSGNTFWFETFKTFNTVTDNFLTEYPEYRLFQIINGNNLITTDGQPKQWKSLEGKTLAYTINYDYSLLSTNQYMLKHREAMWIKKPKLRIQYKDYVQHTSKYIERSALFNPIIDIERTLNQIILNKVKKRLQLLLQMLDLSEKVTIQLG